MGQNRTILLAGFGAAGLMLLAGLGWAAFDAHLRPDPGVGVCESIREHRTLAGDHNGDGTLSHGEYRAARADFASSSVPAIRDSGVRLMDELWHASAAAELSAAGLQTACAEAGVTFTLSDAVDS